jgi:hypothetical protein
MQILVFWMSVAMRESFVEKEGLFGLVKKMVLEHDTTEIALGGFPSYLTSEFLIGNLRLQGILKQRLRLF